MMEIYGNPPCVESAQKSSEGAIGGVTIEYAKYGVKSQASLLPVVIPLLVNYIIIELICMRTDYQENVMKKEQGVDGARRR